MTPEERLRPVERLVSDIDRDVADARVHLIAHVHLMNALRETQVEMSRRLDEHGGVLERAGWRARSTVWTPRSIRWTRR